MLEFDNSLPTYGGVTIAIVIILFFITSITLSKYNVKKNGYYSVLAWIPFARLYLLGKFTIHKLFGFLLMIGIILSGKIILDVDGVEKTYSFLPENIRIIVFYTTITIETFLFALLFFKYEKRKQRKEIGMVVQTDNYVNDSVSRSLRKTPEIEDFRVVQARMRKEQIEKEKSFVESNHIPSDEELKRRNEEKNTKKYVENKMNNQQDFIDNFKI